MRPAHHNVGALPPYRVSFIDPRVVPGTPSGGQWFVMGTVNGDPGNQQGPVAICEYEPSAHAIAALLNASVNPGEYTVKVRGPGLLARLWKRVAR